MISTLLLATVAMAQQATADRQRRVEPTEMTSVTGATVRIPDKEAKATVLVFLLTDCPIANRYGPEIRRIEDKYRKLGVKFVRVYVYEDRTVEEIKEHTADFKYRSPAIHDTQRRLVHAVKASVTPEVAVLSPDGLIQYLGRIDDMYIEHGRLREVEFRPDLRIALDEVLAGKRVSIPRTTALGCFIEG